MWLKGIVMAVFMAVIILLMSTHVNDERAKNAALSYIKHKIEQTSHLHQGAIPARLEVEDTDFRENGHASFSLTVNDQDFYVSYPNRNRDSTILIELLAGTPTELKESLHAYWVHPLPKDLLTCDTNNTPEGMSESACKSTVALLDKPLAALCIPHHNGKPRCIAVEEL